ncbi:MAG: DUF6377 domain-containing protein [Prevotella sp.]|nr:DUF6377 domain-containing protein [Prevotella sp.]
MRHIYLIIALLLASSLTVSASDHEKLLKELDQEVANSGTYIKQKEAEITRLKGNLSVAALPTDRYLSIKQIAIAYSKFDSDSALAYLNRCYQLGEQTKNTEWMQDATIRQAFVFADRGDSFTSTAKLETLGNFANIAPPLREEYAQATLMRYIGYSALPLSQASPAEMQRAWATFIPYIKPNSLPYYLFYIGIHGKYSPRQVEPRIKQLLAKARPHTYDDALARILLYQIYRKMGQDDAALEQLVRSAIADIRCANRSSSSLVSIIELLNGKNDDGAQTSRLLSYIKLAQEDISTYKDVGRSMQLLEAQRKINEDYIQQTHHQQSLLAISLATLFILLLIVLWLWRKSWQKLALRKETFSKQQEEIKQRQQEDDKKEKTIAELTRQLARMEAQRQSMKAAVVKPFRLLSEIIKDIKTYRKDMSRLLAAGMNREAKRLASNSIAKDQAAELLYAQFDDTFLSLHPDFVARFNALLRPECRLVAEKDHSLTPEQRIYALISLGVEESVNIAEILQYSTQTVYNYRLKIRKSTLEPNFKIARYVKEMY